MLLKPRDAAIERGLPDERRDVSFVLQLMAKAAQLWAAPRGDALGQLRRREILPADHRRDSRVVARELEQERRLVAPGARLHRDRRSERMRVHLRPQRSGQVVAGERVHCRADPRIVGRAITPEVLMGIDTHCAHGVLVLHLASSPRAASSRAA